MNNTQITSVEAGSPKDPEGPKGYSLATAVRSLLRDPVHASDELIRSHGGIVRFGLGRATAFLIGDAAGAQHVLRDNAANFVKGDMYERLEVLIGQSLPFSEGALWRRQRRMIQPKFTRDRINDLIPLMTAVIAPELDTLRPSGRHARSIEIGGLSSRIVIKVVLNSIFGTSIASSELEELASATRSVMGHVLLRVATFFLPAWFRIPGESGFRRSLRQLDDFVHGMIVARRAQEHQGSDLLGLLLLARDPESGDRMDNKQIRDEAVTFLVGGTDTTAVMLTWTIYLLCQHRDAEQKVRAEQEAVLGGRVPGADDVGRLVYTRMVLQEAMRLYPPAWIIARKSVQEDVVAGYRIPAGANIGLLPWAIHHDPSIWPDPDQFRPERFLPGNAATRGLGAYIPFGAGQRKCIGDHFAMLDGLLVLTMLMQRYRVNLVPGQKIETSATITLQPRHDIHVTLTDV